jgi:hypothetical protein
MTKSRLLFFHNNFLPRKKGKEEGWKGKKVEEYEKEGYIERRGKEKGKKTKSIRKGSRSYKVHC